MHLRLLPDLWGKKHKDATFPVVTSVFPFTILSKMTIQLKIHDFPSRIREFKDSYRMFSGQGSDKHLNQNLKMGKSKLTFLQRRHTDGQKVHEEMFNITNY